MSKRPKNFKSVRSAVKHGWTPVTIKRREDLSWLGITLNVNRITTGRNVRLYGNDGGGVIAFEDPKDALMIQLKFG